MSSKNMSGDCGKMDGNQMKDCDKGMSGMDKDKMGMTGMDKDGKPCDGKGMGMTGCGGKGQQMGGMNAGNDSMMSGK